MKPETKPEDSFADLAVEVHDICDRLEHLLITRAKELPPGSRGLSMLTGYAGTADLVPELRKLAGEIVNKTAQAERLRTAEAARVNIVWEEVPPGAAPAVGTETGRSRDQFLRRGNATKTSALAEKILDEAQRKREARPKPRLVSRRTQEELADIGDVLWQALGDRTLSKAEIATELYVLGIEIGTPSLTRLLRNLVKARRLKRVDRGQYRRARRPSTKAKD